MKTLFVMLSAISLMACATANISTNSALVKPTHDKRYGALVDGQPMLHFKNNIKRW